MKLGIINRISFRELDLSIEYTTLEEDYIEFVFNFNLYLKNPYDITEKYKNLRIVKQIDLLESFILDLEYQISNNIVI